MNLDEAIKQVGKSNESWNKLKKHASTLEARKTTLTREVVDLLKPNSEFLMDNKEGKVEVDALKKE